MKAIHPAVLIIILVGVINTALAVLVQGPAPFMQRVDPVDFIALEEKNKVSYSTSAELVLYRSNEGVIADALILTPKGDDYALGMVEVINGCISGEAKPRECIIPAPIAKRVIESIKLMMEYQVLAPAGRQGDVASPFSNNCWIWLRTAPTQMITGMVSGYTMHSPRGERAQTFRVLVSALNAAARAEDSVANSHLTDLDLISGRFLATEQSKRSK